MIIWEKPAGGNPISREDQQRTKRIELLRATQNTPARPNLEKNRIWNLRKVCRPISDENLKSGEGHKLHTYILIDIPLVD